MRRGGIVAFPLTSGVFDSTQYLELIALEPVSLFNITVSLLTTNALGIACPVTGCVFFVFYGTDLML